MGKMVMLERGVAPAIGVFLPPLSWLGEDVVDENNKGQQQILLLTLVLSLAYRHFPDLAFLPFLL